MEVNQFVELVKEFGPMAVMIAFFVWRDYRREDRLSKRIETLENEQKTVLIPLVKESASVIAENSAIMGKLEKLLERV